MLSPGNIFHQGNKMAAKSKISKEQWAEAREQWESNPNMTFADLSPELQLTRQAISRKAHRDGWSRGDTAPDVNADVNKKVAQKVTLEEVALIKINNALIRLIESPQTPPDVVLRACEKLLEIGNTGL